jgi:hypothetical protein
MSTFIETLNMSFVRFVYISEDNERRTKILGDKLGLETVRPIHRISRSDAMINHCVARIGIVYLH